MRSALDPSLVGLLLLSLSACSGEKGDDNNGKSGASGSTGVTSASKGGATSVRGGSASGGSSGKGNSAPGNSVAGISGIGAVTTASNGGAGESPAAGAGGVNAGAGGSSGKGGGANAGGLITRGGGAGSTGKPNTGGVPNSGGTKASGGTFAAAAGSHNGGSPGASGASPTGGIAGTPGEYQLPADRATSWQFAGMLTKGGIPSASWPICNSTPLSPSGGDDSVPINAKIESCPAGSVVQLASGTFKMGRGKYLSLDKGVVLRGAGAGATILNNPLNVPATASNQQAADAIPIVIVGPGRWVNPDGDARCARPTAYQTAYMQLLAADGTKGTTSITVEDGGIFKAGQFVLLDETSNASWQPDVSRLSTSIWASSDYAVQWNLHKPAVGGDDLTYAAVTPSTANNWAGIGNGADAACWFCRQDRPQSEMKEIASVNGNTVTFTSPLHKTYRVDHHAELTTFTGDNLLVQNAGLESLTVVGGGDNAVIFTNSAYSWAKNIEVTTWYGAGVSFEHAFRVELRDSYLHDAAWPEPGGAGYAISIGGSSELLIENNISIRANKVMVARSSGAGSVVGYNYMDDGYIATNEHWIEIGVNASHMVGSHHVLFEGNQTFNLDSDDTHGNSTYHTYFRNWASSIRSQFQSGFTGNTIDDLHSSDNGPKRAAGAMRYSYWMSFVGNVLGMSGVTTAANDYVDDQTSTDWGNSIWLLGWNDSAPYTVDTNVAATALRDGNWDFFLGKQTWLNGSATALPKSLYLASKPAFFGTNPWPWTDPTTGTLYTLPAKARYDAGTPNIVP